jgi:hypothetical protein
MRRSFFAAAALSLSACTTIPANGEEPPVREVPDTCQAEAGQRYIGSRATAEVGAAIVESTDSRELRWLPPGTIVTMEYKFGRVNVSYDENYRITRVTCG